MLELLHLIWNVVNWTNSLERDRKAFPACLFYTGIRESCKKVAFFPFLRNFSAFFASNLIPNGTEILSMSGQVSQQDAVLIEACLTGRTEAFGTLVLRYQDRLYSSLVYLLGNTDDAREVSQETFMQAFLKIDKFRGESQFYTWLYRIARNVAISQRRRHKPTLPLDEVCQGGFEIADGTDGPVERLKKVESRRSVYRAIDRLSDEHREVIVLREFDQLDYATIGEILRIPVGTVRSRIARARESLKRELTRDLVSKTG